MKILVSVDIEGIAGVVHPDQTRPGHAEYERARRLMTFEANAAVRGALAGGASAVIVSDSHGPFRNLLAEESAVSDTCLTPEITPPSTPTSSP